MGLAEIIAAVNLFNQTVPAATGLILSLRNENGEEMPLTTLDAAEDQVKKNIDEAEAFLARNKQGS